MEKGSEDWERESESHISNVMVSEIQKPMIREFSSGVRRVSEYSTVSLKCIVAGYPPPKVTWYKDNLRITTNSSLNVTLAIDGRWVSSTNTFLISNHLLGTVLCWAFLFFLLVIFISSWWRLKTLLQLYNFVTSKYWSIAHILRYVLCFLV